MIRRPELKRLPDPTSRTHAETEACLQGLSIPPRDVFVPPTPPIGGLGNSLVHCFPLRRNPPPTDSFPVSTASP